MQELKEASRRRGSFLGSLKAVAWAFFGIRGRSAHENDIAKLNPVHLIIAGVLCTALFIATLLLAVRWAVGAG